jgi:hypothetical protein
MTRRRPSQRAGGHWSARTAGSHPYAAARDQDQRARHVPDRPAQRWISADRLRSDHGVDLRLCTCANGCGHPQRSFPGGRFSTRDEGERARFAAYALYRRAAEAAVVRAHATDLLSNDGQHRPVIPLGDFNDEPEAATTQILLGPPGSEIKTGGFDTPDQGDAQRLWNLAPRVRSAADVGVHRVRFGWRRIALPEQFHSVGVGSTGEVPRPGWSLCCPGAVRRGDHAPSRSGPRRGPVGSRPAIADHRRRRGLRPFVAGPVRGPGR